MRERKGFVLILVLVFGFVAAAATFIVPRIINQPLRQSIREIVSQIQVYENLVKEDPENLKYRTHLGELYFKQGNWEKAIENFAKALEVEPQNVDLRINLGVIYWHAGQVEEGIKYLDEAIEIDPTQAEAHFYKGMMLSGMEGREEEVIAELGKVLELSKDQEQNSQMVRSARVILQRMKEEQKLAGLFPKTLQDMSLIDSYTGERAVKEIEGLHGSKFRIAKGYVASYSDSNGSKKASFWVSESDSAEEAKGLLAKMLDVIEKDDTPFSVPKDITIEDIETVVYVEGIGRSHYIWSKGQLLIWMALEGFSSEEQLSLIEEAIKAIPPS